MSAQNQPEEFSIAFDIGYSAIKAMTTNMRDPYKDVSLAFKPTEELEDKTADKIVRVSGESYLTGEHAAKNMKSLPERPNRETDFHGSQKQMAMMCSVLEELKLFEVSGKTLCLSVPYQKVSDKALISKLKALKSLEWEVSPEGKPLARKVDFQNTEVIPQGIGALAHHGCLNNPSYKSIGILEIGSNTIDAVVLTWSRKYNRHEYNHEVSDSLRGLNMDEFFERVRLELKKVDGLQDRVFSYTELSEMMEYSDYDIVSNLGVVDSKDVENAVLRSKSWFTDELEKHARSQWGDAIFDGLHLFIISGGGAGAVIRDQWKYESRTKFGDAFDNVRGQANAIQ